jgi:predicted transcriptional regulator of viral defense system
MTMIDATAFLARHPLFTTRQFALATGRRIDSASRTLSRLAGDQAIVQITRGIWAQPAHPHFQPLGAVPLLLMNEQGYVSFLTALHLHGVISQIPNSIQAATTGHGRTLDSPIGKFEFLQIKPAMMTAGIEMTHQRAPYPLATAEKALLDTFYIATRRGRRFSRLPELDLGDLNAERFQELMTAQVQDPAIRTAIWRRFETAGQRQHT